MTTDSVNPEQYSFGKILLLTLLPGILIIGVGLLVPYLGGFHDGIKIGFYFVLEAAILLGLIAVFTNSKSISSILSAIPYQNAVSVRWFLILLVLVTAYAISFRDIFSIDVLNAAAMSLMGTFSGWPPADGLYPGKVAEFTPATAAGRISFAGYSLVTIGLASAMQTIYFRGFLLPRMDRLGWWAPVINNVLFVVFHLASPFFWGHFLIFTFFWGIVTYATRNVWIAVISHVLFNTYYDIWILVKEIWFLF